MYKVWFKYKVEQTFKLFSEKVDYTTALWQSRYLTSIGAIPYINKILSYEN